jgi:hypothetical protein
MSHFIKRHIRCLSIFLALVSFSNSTVANAKDFSEDVIHSTCSGSENSAERILKRLSNELAVARESISKDFIKQVFFLEMNDYRNELRLQLQKISEADRGKITSLLLSSTAENFKFALCEKLKNPKMQDDAIKLDTYLKCRETIKTEVEQTPPPCF